MVRKIIIYKGSTACLPAPVIINKKKRVEVPEVKIPRSVYIMTNYWFWFLTIPFSLLMGAAYLCVKLDVPYVSLWIIVLTIISMATALTTTCKCAKAIKTWNELID